LDICQGIQISAPADHRCLLNEPAFVGREHADDFVWPIIEHYLAADDIWVAAESSLPQIVTNDDNCGPAVLASSGKNVRPLIVLTPNNEKRLGVQADWELPQARHRPSICIQIEKTQPCPVKELFCAFQSKKFPRLIGSAD
jgi:hypothetical protein